MPMSFTTLKSAAFSMPSAITSEPQLSAMCWIARRNCTFTGSSEMPGHEMLVRLHELRAQLRPEPQAREALAQVVDGDAKAHRAIEHQRLVDPPEIHRGVVLGELDHHAAGLEPEARQEPLRALLVVAALRDELRRDVEEDAPVQPACREGAQDLPDARDIELEGHVLGLGRGKELGRRLESESSGPRTSAS